MANRLRVQVGEFKEKLPLIQTLFNPGLRDRHWEQISMIVGQPIKPDEDTTLNKIIEMDIVQHIPKLEQISEAASKELEELLRDIKLHPKRYFRILSKKEIPFEASPKATLK